jgi:hypothetical protein
MRKYSDGTRTYFLLSLAILFLHSCALPKRTIVDNVGVPDGRLGDFLRNNKKSFVLYDEYPSGLDYVDKEIFIKKEYNSTAIPKITELQDLNTLISNQVKLFFYKRDSRILNNMGFKCNQNASHCFYESINSVYYLVDSSKATEKINISLRIDENKFTIYYVFLFSKQFIN